MAALGTGRLAALALAAAVVEVAALVEVAAVVRLAAAAAVVEVVVNVRGARLLMPPAALTLPLLLVAPPLLLLLELVVLLLLVVLLVVVLVVAAALPLPGRASPARLLGLGLRAELGYANGFEARTGAGAGVGKALLPLLAGRVPMRLSFMAMRNSCSSIPSASQSVSGRLRLGAPMLG